MSYQLQKSVILSTRFRIPSCKQQSPFQPVTTEGNLIKNGRYLKESAMQQVAMTEITSGLQNIGTLILSLSD